ncbi:MAG: glycosyltransferase family 39 protein [Actinomycetota bacterium]|nr:glycosyltransferase family 39 protein [Actinomycetota bacterium]
MKKVWSILKENFPGISLLLILLVAFAVRVWGIRFGLPNLYHPDEWAIVDRALGILRTGDYNPHDFGYPSLYMYIEGITFIFHFFYGVSKGLYTSLADIQLPGFYLWGRLTTAFLGTSTVYIVYLIGRRMFGEKVGLLSALLLAFSFFHVKDSHYITVDVPASFFVALSFLFCYLILEKGEKRHYILAGLFAGLSMATKWNVAPILLSLIVAYLLASWRNRALTDGIFIGLLAFGLGLFIGTPYAFLDLPKFLNDLAGIMVHYRGGHPGFEASVPWLFYLKHMASSEGLGVAIFLCAAGGILLSLMRRSDKDLLLLSFPLVYFLLVSSSKVTFPRNVLPLYPFLVLYGGCFLSEIIKFLSSRFRLEGGKKNLIVAGLLVLVLTMPVIRIVQFDYGCSIKDTRTRAAEWVEKNLPRGSKIAAEFYAPPISRNFEVVKFPFLDRPPEWFLEQNFDYLVFDGADFQRYFDEPDKYHEQVEKYNKLFRLGTLIKDFKADERVEGFLSPEIRIYKVSS